MNKIGQWANPEEFLPIPDKVVLLKTKLEAESYRMARLDQIQDHTNKALFLCEADEDGTIAIDDVIAWCYIDLDIPRF